jgi:hypothetical protein
LGRPLASADPLPGWEIHKGINGPTAATYLTSFTYAGAENRKVFSAGRFVPRRSWDRVASP